MRRKSHSKQTYQIHWRSVQETRYQSCHSTTNRRKYTGNHRQSTTREGYNFRTLEKYHQDNGTWPLLDEPWLYLDSRAFGEGPHVEAILDGTYVCPDNTDPAVKTFLIHLQQPTTVSDKEPPTMLSLAAYRESWKIFKENMSSQGPHIRIYKAAAHQSFLG